MNLWKIISSFVLGRSWWLILGIGLLSAISAGTVAWKLQTLRWEHKVDLVQTEYDNFKISVKTDALDATNKSLSESMKQLKSISDILKQAENLKNRQLIESSILIKGLNDYQGKSCPVSPAILDYANKLREFQKNNGNH